MNDVNDVNELREAILDKVRGFFKDPIEPSIAEALSNGHDDMLQLVYQGIYLALEKDRLNSILPPIAILPDEPTPFVEGDEAFGARVGTIKPSDVKINIIQPTEDKNNHSQND